MFTLSFACSRLDVKGVEFDVIDESSERSQSLKELTWKTEAERDKAFQEYIQQCYKHESVPFIQVKEEKSKAGDYRATFELAEYYSKGMFPYISKNEKRAKELYFLASKQGSVDAYHELALAVKFGRLGYKKNYSVASQWFSNLLKHIKRREAMEKESSFDSYDLLKRSIYLDLANMLDEGGFGLQKDMEKSVFWLTKLAELGEEAICYRLGVLFCRYDRGVKRDFSKSVFFFSKIKQDLNWLGEAQTYLAMIYQVGGDGIEQNFEKSRDYFIKAMAIRSPHGIYRVAKLIRKTNVLFDVNRQKAKTLLESIEVDREWGVCACLELSSFYEASERGLQKDLEKVFDYYSKVEQLGGIDHAREKDLCECPSS